MGAPHRTCSTLQDRCILLIIGEGYKEITLPERTTVPLWFPETDTSALIAIFISAITVIGLLILAEYLRRRYLRITRVRREWRVVDEILRTKEFSPEERQILFDLIERYAPEEPIRAITQNTLFNHCIERAMNAVLNTPEAFSERGDALRQIRVRLGLDFVPFGLPISSTRDLHVGQALWVAPGVTGGLQWTRATIVGIDEARFRIAPRAESSTDTSGMSPARTGTPSFGQEEVVRFFLWREDDARYEFRAALIASSQDPMEWIFHHVTPINRIQVRNHYRVRFDQQTTVRILRAPKEDEHMLGYAEKRTLAHLSGRICSLSAGGLAVVTAQPAPLHAFLRVKIHLPEEGTVDVEARIVSVEPITAGRCLLRGKFVDISENTQDTISRYVWRRQQPKPTSQTTEESSEEKQVKQTKRV